jgi:hypothetical protein
MAHKNPWGNGDPAQTLDDPITAEDVRYAREAWRDIPNGALDAEDRRQLAGRFHIGIGTVNAWIEGRGSPIPESAIGMRPSELSDGGLSRVLASRLFGDGVSQQEATKGKEESTWNVRLIEGDGRQAGIGTYLDFARDYYERNKDRTSEYVRERWKHMELRFTEDGFELDIDYDHDYEEAT